MPTAPARARPATKRQLEVCRRIASQTGRTFTVPLSFDEARKIITAAKGRARAKRRR